MFPRVSKKAALCLTTQKWKLVYCIIEIDQYKSSKFEHSGFCSVIFMGAGGGGVDIFNAVP
jgi:hypothetical protein